MSSVQTRDGLQVDVQWNSDAFYLRLHRDWACGRPNRVRRLAVMTLHANGWTMEMIADAMGWKARGHAARIVNETKAALKEHFETMNAAAGLPSQGFHLDA